MKNAFTVSKILTSVKEIFHRTKSHVSVFLKRGGNMQFHVSVMTSYVYVNVVYAATETRENVTKPVTETQVIRRVSGTV